MQGEIRGKGQREGKGEKIKEREKTKETKGNNKEIEEGKGYIR